MKGSFKNKSDICVRDRTCDRDCYAEDFLQEIVKANVEEFKKKVSLIKSTEGMNDRTRPLASSLNDKEDNKDTEDKYVKSKRPEKSEVFEEREGSETKKETAEKVIVKKNLRQLFMFSELMKKKEF
jgi:hypothetical protein